MKPYVVATAVDAAQFPAALFLLDRLSRLNPPADTEIILFSDSERDLLAARDIPERRFTLRLLKSPVKFRGSGHISGAAFYRLLLPKLTGARRLLYLDADTYPESDAIWSLLKLDLDGAMAAAVRDLTLAFLDSESHRAELERTDTLESRRYMNSGVLLIDAEAFTAEHMAERLIQFIGAMSIGDQTALNVALDGRWVELSPAMNMQPIGYQCGLISAVEPVITHFAGPIKPWHGSSFYLDHRARAEIEAFLAATEWREFLTQERPPNAAFSSWAPPLAFLASVQDYLAGTRFADVEQGIIAAPKVHA